MSIGHNYLTREISDARLVWPVVAKVAVTVARIMRGKVISGSLAWTGDALHKRRGGSGQRSFQSLFQCEGPFLRTEPPAGRGAVAGRDGADPIMSKSHLALKWAAVPGIHIFRDPHQKPKAPEHQS